MGVRDGGDIDHAGGGDVVVMGETTTMVLEYGKVRCPVCGALLPTDENMAANHNHLIWRDSNPERWHIVCPRRLDYIFPESEFIKIEVGNFKVRTLRSSMQRKELHPPRCKECGKRMWRVGRRGFDGTFKCPACGKRIKF